MVRLVPFLSAFTFFTGLQAVYLVSCLFQGHSGPTMSQSCTDYACDSTIVKNLLHQNGLGAHTVSSLTDTAPGGRVQAIDLRYSGIHTIPPEIGSLSALKELILFNNTLSTLPPEIGRLTKLVYLDLNKNHIESLPNEIGQLTSLEKLWLGTNRLRLLPETLGQLKSLKSLSLNDNLLTEVPTSLGGLSNLEELDLQGNRLKSLPEAINSLGGITYLDIDNNHLCSLSLKVEQWIDSHAINKAWRQTQTCD